MPVVISSKPGVVRRLNDSAVQGTIPSLVALKDPEFTFGDQLAIITSIGVKQHTNHQFMQTLGADIYIYVFGDRMGDMALSGVAFAKDCEEMGDTEHGMAKVMRWYRDNRLAKRRDPVDVVLGNADGEPFSGFVTGMNLNLLDLQSMLVTFELRLALVPEK